MENPFQILFQRLGTVEELLIDIKHRPTQAPILAEEVLTIEQASVLLNLAKQTVYGMVSARKIPFCKPTGAQLYFLRSDLIDWLRKHRTATTEEALEAYEEPVPRTRPARRRNNASPTRKAA